MDEWEASVDGRKDLSDADKQKMCISRETLEGLRFTGMSLDCALLVIQLEILILFLTAKSFVELARYLLKQPGVNFVLSAKLSQDPLESFFGKQRMRGGYCDNPNVATFLYGAQSLRVQGKTAIKPTRGNCKRGRAEHIAVDSTPLPKRQHLASHK